MDWSNILPAIIAIITAIVFPFILKKRKKEGPKKRKDYAQSLDELGLKFEKIDKGDDRVSFIKKQSFSQKAEGIFALKEKNIDFLFIMSVTSQYGINYFIEFIVKNTFNLRDEPLQNTRMKLKRESFVSKKYVDLFWKGDSYLAQKLSMDYDLKHKLLNYIVNEEKVILTIIPEKKHGYTKIKTNFIPLTDEFISLINSLAGHIKTGL